MGIFTLLNFFQAEYLYCLILLRFPGSSDGKEFTCNVGDLGWEDPLEEGMANHPSILAWRIPMNRGALWATVHGVAEPDTTE